MSRLPARRVPWGAGSTSGRGRLSRWSCLAAPRGGRRGAGRGVAALPGLRPDDDWPAARRRGPAGSRGGRGAVVVVPDHRDVDRVDAALVRRLGQGAARQADGGPGTPGPLHRLAQGPARTRAGRIGTRAAAFAPVRDLGLVASWDDGDDLLSEPRAPYHHTGVVLSLRAEQTGAALLSGGFVRSLRLEAEVEAGQVVPVVADHDVVRVRRRGSSSRGRASTRSGTGPPPGPTCRRGPGAWPRTPCATGPSSCRSRGAATSPALSCGECRTRCGARIATGRWHWAPAGSEPPCRWCSAGLGPSGASSAGAVAPGGVRPRSPGRAGPPRRSARSCPASP